MIERKWISKEQAKKIYPDVKVKKTYPHKTLNGKKDRVHRHVMEEKLGRALTPSERVYHKDGDHLNNDPDNLIVIEFNLAKKDT